MQLSWRRFKVLLKGLPADSAFINQVMDERPDWRQTLSKSSGRPVATEHTTLDDFMAREVRTIGAVKG